MTPMVRWRAPTGRMAFAGMARSAEAFGEVTSEAKRWREAWNWGFDEGVMSGRQRKWVSWGFGGIGELEEGETMWKALVRVELDERRVCSTSGGKKGASRRITSCLMVTSSPFLNNGSELKKRAAALILSICPHHSSANPGTNFLI